MGIPTPNTKLRSANESKLFNENWAKGMKQDRSIGPIKKKKRRVESFEASIESKEKCELLSPKNIPGPQILPIPEPQIQPTKKNRGRKTGFKKTKRRGGKKRKRN